MKKYERRALMGKIKNIAYFFVAAIGAGLSIYVFVKYIFVYLLPFVIALGIAMLVTPLCELLHGKTRIPKRILRVIFAILITLGSVALICLGVWRLSLEVWHFLDKANAEESLMQLISGELFNGGFLGNLFGGMTDKIVSAIYSFAISMLGSLAGIVSNIISAVPRAFLFVIVTVISSAYFAWDFDKLKDIVKSRLNDKQIELLRRIRRGSFSVIVKYIGAYFLLMCITFVIMLVGLSVLNVKYNLLLSVIIAIVDILPILGVGTILLPYSFYAFATGNTYLAVGLIILFGAYTLLRQVLEPKIVGKHLGIHPLFTLSLIYISYSLFGFMGLLIVPIVVCVIDVFLKKKDTSEVG